LNEVLEACASLNCFKVMRIHTGHMDMVLLSHDQRETWLFAEHTWTLQKMISIALTMRSTARILSCTSYFTKALATSILVKFSTCSFAASFWATASAPRMDPWTWPTRRDQFGRPKNVSLQPSRAQVHQLFTTHCLSNWAARSCVFGNLLFSTEIAYTRSTSLHTLGSEHLSTV